MEERATNSRRRRATLRDIAKDVGVATGTVSVVLNGSRSGTSVSDKTREAIHESAKRLGYRPNWVAKSLQGGSTRTIGIIPSEAKQDFLLGPHIQRILNATANVLAANHHDLLVLTRCDQSDEKGILQGVVNGRIDGAIVVAPHAESQLVQTLSRAHFPFAVIDAEPGLHPAIFNADDADGTRIAVEHLRGLGHERIAYISGDVRLRSAHRRLQEFLRLFGPNAVIEQGDFEIASGERAMAALLQRSPRPTAVLCANDEMAMGAYNAAMRAGLSVPGGVSIVGYDDAPYSQVVQPSLTTYAQPVEDMARAATTAILRNLEFSEPIQGATLPGHLVIRDSTSRPK
ncbi:LacI family transcriptional regulator [bacterium]|nr:MAG: LacI family transcriptional regulator [bacterium]